VQQYHERQRIVEVGVSEDDLEVREVMGGALADADAWSDLCRRQRGFRCTRRPGPPETWRANGR
jgi:hypothetical protein